MALNLQKTCETMHKASCDKIITSNAVLKNYKGETVDIEAEYNRLLKIENQLQIIKVAVTTINVKSKTKLDKKTMSELIVELSDLKRRQSLLTTLFNQKNNRRNGKNEDAYTFILPKARIEERLKEVEDRIKLIKETFTDFNQSTIIKIEIDEDLDLL